MKQLQEALDAFRCYKNRDVEVFLRRKAIDYVKREICSVYLFLDADLLDERRISVEAYFTLSHKALELDSKVSATKRKKLASSKDAEMISIVLIGQLGKYMHIDGSGDEKISALSSTELLDHAMEITRRANELIVCKSVLVETRFEEKLYRLYEGYGFQFLQDNSYRELKQFFLRLKFKQ